MANESCHCLLSDKDLKEKILKENPVPKNNDPVKILDHTLTKILKGRQETLADKDLETVQSKNSDVLGLMYRLWTIIKKAADRKTHMEKKIKSLWKMPLD